MMADLLIRCDWFAARASRFLAREVAMVMVGGGLFGE